MTKAQPGGVATAPALGTLAQHESATDKPKQPPAQAALIAAGRIWEAEKRAAGLDPGQIDAEGRHRQDGAGKKLYLPVVEIPDTAARTRFQAAALAAVDRLLGDSPASAAAPAPPRASLKRHAPPRPPEGHSPLPDDDISDIGRGSAP